MNVEFLRKKFSLEGKSALVTGAAGGIGSEVALELTQAGARVAVCDIDEAGARRVSAALPDSIAVSLDLSRAASIDEAVAEVLRQLGRIDILVNCAGVNKREPVLDVSEETFDSIVDVNLKGLYLLSQRVARGMKEHGGGRIIHFGSLTSAVGLGDVSVYAATKGGVAQLTKAMAVEWAKFGIRVNCVCPGFIKTPLTVPLWENEERSRWMLERISLGRPGLPEDVAATVLFLAAPAADYLTGTVHFVDGGFMAGGQPW